MSEAEFFIARVGLDWLDPKTGKNVRVEAGGRCDGVPTTSRGWLLDQGLIEPCDSKGKPLPVEEPV